MARSTFTRLPVGAHQLAQSDHPASDEPWKVERPKMIDRRGIIEQPYGVKRWGDIKLGDICLTDHWPSTNGGQGACQPL